MKKDLPSLETLHRILRYDEGTGLLYWRERRSNNTRAGDLAGCIGPRGYGELRVDGSTFRTHRLIWKMHYGEDPPQWIDHIDGDRANNRLQNLRLATSSQNCQNKRTVRNGLKGVSAERNGRWRAQIERGGKKLHLGCFSSEEEAHQAYISAAKSLFGDFARGS